jgi:competence protein ComEC
MALRIHFLNVGHGDCTIIEHPSGHISMIDINNCKTLTADEIELFNASTVVTASIQQRNEQYYQDRLVDPIEYWKENFAGKSLFRYIQTHPDMDHMSGLYRLIVQEDSISVINFWHPGDTKTIEDVNWDKGFYDRNDWDAYQSISESADVEVVKVKVIKPEFGDTNEFYTSDEITVLGPTKKLRDEINSDNEGKDSRSWNDISYMLKVSHAGRAVILPGDAESEAWETAMENAEGHFDCDVLKASHHGRESGFHEVAVKTMSPKWVIASVGKEPSTSAAELYEQNDCKYFSTREHGTVVLEIADNGSITLTDIDGNVETL